MKVFVLCIICLLIVSNSLAIEEDKKIHMGASFACGVVGAMIVEVIDPDISTFEKWMLATAIGTVPGIIKELIDSRTGSGFDKKDLLADVVGASAAPAFIYTVTWEW